MSELKNTPRSTVRIGYNGRVLKQYKGNDARERFETETKVLRYLETKQCPNVPRLLEEDSEALTIVTTNCGAHVSHLSDQKVNELFSELETVYGVKHGDAYARNVTYRASDGRFCIIDFELSEIVEEDKKSS